MSDDWQVVEEALEHPRVEARDAALAALARLREREAQGEQLAKAAKELYDDAGVDDIDQRLDYLMLQVSREAWNDFVAAVKP